MKCVLMAVMLLLGLTGCGAPEKVRAVAPRVGPLEETLTEEAVTRLAEIHVVRTPAEGRIERIRWEPGDRVRRGEVLVCFDARPAELEHLESAEQEEARRARWTLARTTAVEEAAVRQALAQLSAAQHAQAAWSARREQALARSEHADVEAARSRSLFSQDAIPRQRLEADEVTARTARQLVRELEAQVKTQADAVVAAREQLGEARARLERRSQEGQIALHELGEAHARYLRTGHELIRQTVRSPVNGVVLERFEQGPGHYSAGTRLLALGDPSRLEARAEVLTEDALRLSPGTPVRLEAAPGRPVLAGRVQRIEPAGFTKFSSLGVEQRRVNVIIRFLRPPAGLGLGYRLRARFVVGQAEEALLVPRASVLEKPDGTCYVLVVENGRLRERTVQLGLQGELEVQVLTGLTSADRLVALPETTMQEGQRAEEE